MAWKLVHFFYSSASWVVVNRCDIESSYILMIFSTLYQELVCHVEHFSFELDTLLHQHDKWIAKELKFLLLYIAQYAIELKELIDLMIIMITDLIYI